MVSISDFFIIVYALEPHIYLDDTLYTSIEDAETNSEFISDVYKVITLKEYISEVKDDAFTFPGTG